jgi:hypothetical protein
MRAIWTALPANERRVARALAVLDSPIHAAESAAAVGIKRSSITRAVDGLRDNADVIVDPQGRLRITDPLFEHWLAEQGLTPATGADAEPLDA